MESVEELAQYFVYKITQARVGIESRIGSAMKSIPQLMKRGWGLNEIKEELDIFAQTYPQVVLNIYHIDEIMAKKEPPNNLIESGMFYYHNELREISPPTRIYIDQNGKIVRESKPFFLEMKKSFSMKDLLAYWYKKMDITPNDHMVRQDEGKFKYILNNYCNLDELLFAIDVARSSRIDKQQRLLRNAFDIEKYIDEAKEFIKAKENTHKLQGINREVKQHDSNERYYGSGHPYN